MVNDDDIRNTDEEKSTITNGNVSPIISTPDDDTIQIITTDPPQQKLPITNSNNSNNSNNSKPTNNNNYINNKYEDENALLKIEPGKIVKISPIKEKSSSPIPAQNFNSSTVAINDETTEWELVPPDGGWGWLVLGGAMLVNILVPGTIKSFGVLFVEFIEAFDASPTTAAWIPALCYFLYSSLGPLSSILSVKYSYRTVTLIGGTFAAVGMMLSYWASSVAYLYVSYGVFVGIGAGLSFPPTVYIVTSYFVRLRGLANGICISGSAFGSIILPPILRVLLETYGYRGAVLIMGAITLNTWVAAIFYEPVENHLKRVVKKPLQLDLDDDDDDGGGGGGGGGGYFGDDRILNNPAIEEEADEGITLQFKHNEEEQPPQQQQQQQQQPQSNKDEQSTKPKFLITSDETPVSTPKTSLVSPLGTPFKYTAAGGKTNVEDNNNNGNNGFARSISAVVVQNCTTNKADESLNNNNNNNSSRQRKISTPVRELNSRNNTFINQLNSQPSLYAVPESRFSHSRLSRVNQYRNSQSGGVGGGPSSKPKRSPSTSSFQYVSTPYHGSTLTFQPQEFASHLSLKSIASSINPVGSCSKKSKGDPDKSSKNKFLDLSLLRDPTYLVILISNSTNAIGYTNFIILLPAYAGALGFDKNLGAYLLSIVSALDLIGRIGGSALSDTGLIPKTWYFVGGLTISGFSLSLLPFASSYSMVSFWCAVFGLASGTYVGVTAVIMADMLGTERLTSSYGISLFVNGILQLIGPPLCGLWFDSIGTFTPLFHTLGLILLSGASLWIAMPFINRRKRMQHKKLIERERRQQLEQIDENEKELLA